jgi:hypothetical protein
MEKGENRREKAVTGIFPFLKKAINFRDLGLLSISQNLDSILDT